MIDWRHYIPRWKKNARRRSGIALAYAKIEQGFSELSRLRDSTAKEELPEGLKRVVEKLRREDD